MTERKVKNIEAQTVSTRSMFANGFVERFDLEQYFWTEDTVQALIQALEYTTNCCCLTTPSLGHGFYLVGRHEVVLDIDDRFSYLPKFHYFDLRSPYAIDDEGNPFQIIVMDPPFFYIPMDVIYNAVMTILNGDSQNVKLMIGFLKRESPALLEAFKDFHLRETNFPLKYATVKPNKWQNYALYSNIDLPGIKRLK